MVIYVACFLILFFDPDPFDYFRYSFKKKRSTLAFWTIYIVAVVSSSVLVSTLPQLGWPSMIPLVLVIIYILILMPYKQGYENYRCLFNILTMLSFLGLRVFLQYTQTPVNQSNNAYIIHLVNIILLFIVVLLTIICMVYHFYYLKFIKPHEQKSFQEKVMIEL